MIHVEKHGSVVAIRMARALFGRPLYWTAAYWVDGLLIDTGPSCAAGELLRALEAVHVDQIVLTHAHEDHFGGLYALKERYPEAKVYAPWRSIPTIEEPQRLQMQLYRRWAWGTPEGVAGVMALDEIDNVISTPDFRFRAVETPGHSPDHVCLYEPTRRWVFSGDAFIGGCDEAWVSDFDMFGIVSSLRTIASLRPERLFSGSGTVRRTPQPEIHQKIRYLIGLTREVTRLEKLGLSVPEIAVCLFKEEPRITFWTRGHFSAANLIEACRSYNAIFSPFIDLDVDAPTADMQSDDHLHHSDGSSHDPSSNTEIGNV